MTTLDLKIQLPDGVVAFLQREASTRRVSLDVVVGEVMTDYFDEPSEAEILESLRIGMEEALASEGRPALEVLDEIDREMMGNADDR